MLNWAHFGAWVRSVGTHLAVTSPCLVKMWRTCGCEISSVLAVGPVLSCQSAITWSQILAITSWLAAVANLSGQGSSCTLSLPLLDSTDCFLTMVWDGASSPQLLSMSWVTLACNPFFFKYQMMAWHSVVSIFMARCHSGHWDAWWHEPWEERHGGSR